jgi:hypothetical protein
MKVYRNWYGNKDPRLPCPSCDGEGVVDVMLPARHSAQESPDYAEQECDACQGCGCVQCEECGEDVLIEFEPCCSAECKAKVDPSG